MQVLIVVRSDCGQSETGPSAVFDQSSLRKSAPISPPPGKAACEFLSNEFMMPVAPDHNRAKLSKYAKVPLENARYF